MNGLKVDRNKILIVLGAVVLVVLVVLLALDQRQKIGAGKNNQGSGASVPVQSLTTASPEELAVSKGVIPLATATPETLKTAQAVASGASLITASNIVVTPQGTPVKLNVAPASFDAPTESAPVASSSIPNNANTIKMTISAAGFTPNTFTVKAGQLVNFALTSTDNFSHIWMPDDPALTGTILGVAGMETRMKSWNAPKKGTYPFHCVVPGHAARGEAGTMIVE
ncbi:MAG: cupredoxin domain-containing protein [Patescibacteria group bacterium]|jgi:heme/copper-type cytochrome/quinol oxidase subunit 2